MATSVPSAESDFATKAKVAAASPAGTGAVQQTAPAAGAQNATAPKQQQQLQRIEEVSAEWILVANDQTDVQQVNRVGDKEAILFDSGCARSVCPPRFASCDITRQDRHSFTTADGRPLRHCAAPSSRSPRPTHR